MAYDNPAGLIAAAVIGQTLVYLLVALRFKTRYRHGRKVFAADWLILLAAILSTGLSTLQIHGAAVGRLGVPVHGSIGSPTFKESTALNLRWYQWGVFINGVVVTGLVKISVSFFYMQIFAVKYRNIVLPWLLLMIAWTTGFTILMLTFCGNHGLWPSIPLAKEKQQCLSGTKIGYAIVIGHAITDFFTVLLPIPMVVSLRLPLKRKLAVLAIFAVGLLSVGGSVAKAYIYISGALKKTKSDYATLITAISVWGLVESQVGIIAACIMTLRPLLKDASNSTTFNNLINSTRTLFGSRSGTSFASASKTGFTKFGSEHPEGIRSGDENIRKDEEMFALEGVSTISVPPGAIHVQKDVDVSNYSY